jgi:methyltransferase
MLAALLLPMVFVPMILEARVSARNAVVLRRAGASEPAGDVYAFMQAAYPGCFLAMIAEAWLRGVRADVTFAAGLTLFIAAKGLKYWAIGTLGERWTFRVLVPPGSSLTRRGPYRLMRHPNYVGVIGELVGMAVMSRAWVSGTLSIAVFGALLLARIRVEEAALGVRPKLRGRIAQ